jgi:ABC-type polar amino acid transport system ATPase subunit
VGECGEIIIDGIRINDRFAQPAPGSAVFQHRVVFAFAASSTSSALRRQRCSADGARTIKLLDRLGLKHHSRKYPDKLCGGRQQRVATARVRHGSDCHVVRGSDLGAWISEAYIPQVLDVGRFRPRRNVVTHETGFASMVAYRVMFMDKTILRTRQV